MTRLHMLLLGSIIGVLGRIEMTNDGIVAELPNPEEMEEDLIPIMKIRDGDEQWMVLVQRLEDE